MVDRQIEAWARECIAEDWDDHLPGYYRDMDIAAFAKLVRASALEEAAQIAEQPDVDGYPTVGEFIAQAIRTLQPTG